jgi:hypothetical protein
MLESSLRAERAKSKALAAGDKSAVENEALKETKGKAAAKLDPRSGKTPEMSAAVSAHLSCALSMADNISYSLQQTSQFLLERRRRLERV